MKLEVKVYPSSGKQEIKEISRDKYSIYLKKPPENNKANIELLKLLKKYFKKDLRIVKGKSSKNKIIELIN